MQSIQQLIHEKEARSWVPACGGSEQPFQVQGRRVQYMWNTFTGEHAYYDLEADVFLDQEQTALLGL